MKTVFGYLLRLLGILFSISLIGGFFNIISGNISEITIGKIEDISAFVLSFFLAYICFKFGNKKLDEVKKAKKDHKDI